MFSCHQPESEEGYGLDLASLALLDELTANCNDMDSFSRRILVEKIRLVDEKRRNSDCFRMLCILDTIGQCFDIPIDDNASEMTYYLRFAILLDYVFGGSDINMTNGEVVAEATRMAMERHIKLIWT